MGEDGYGLGGLLGKAIGYGARAVSDGLEALNTVYKLTRDPKSAEKAYKNVVGVVGGFVDHAYQTLKEHYTRGEIGEGLGKVREALEKMDRSSKNGRRAIEQLLGKEFGELKPRELARLTDIWARQQQGIYEKL